MNQSPSSSEALTRLPTAPAARATEKVAAPHSVSADRNNSSGSQPKTPGATPLAPGTLTPRQSDALAFIRSFQAENGFGPSYIEIAEALGLASGSGAHRIVHGLEERGALCKPFGSSRNYQLAENRDARFHLQMVLDSFNENGILRHDDAAVLKAMRFLGWRK